MQHLEVSGAVRPLKWSLGVKWLSGVGEMWVKIYGSLWSDTDRRKPNYCEKNVSECHFVQHKSHTLKRWMNCWEFNHSNKSDTTRRWPTLRHGATIFRLSNHTLLLCLMLFFSLFPNSHGTGVLSRW